MNHTSHTTPTPEALADICKLAQGADRIAIALSVVANEHLSASQVRQLRDIIRQHERARENSGIRQEPEDVVIDMLSSLSLSDTGLVSFSLPRGISVLDGISAFNAARCATRSNGVRDIIYQPDVDQILSQVPGALEKSNEQSRRISLQLAVPGLIGKTRAQQESMLAKQGMTFAKPCEVALAAGLLLRASVINSPSICRVELAGKLIRTSEPFIAIAPEWSNGITVISLSSVDQGSSHGYRQFVASAEAR